MMSGGDDYQVEKKRSRSKKVVKEMKRNEMTSVSFRARVSLFLFVSSFR